MQNVYKFMQRRPR